MSYVAMTVLALVCAYLYRGLRRGAGALIIATYMAFAVVLLMIAY